MIVSKRQPTNIIILKMSTKEMNYLVQVLSQENDLKTRKKKTLTVKNQIKELMRKQKRKKYNMGKLHVTRTVSKTVRCTQKNIEQVFGKKGLELYKKKCGGKLSERFTFKIKSDKTKTDVQ